MTNAPTWRRVYDDIRRQIESGELEPGEQLPSTQHLMREYGHLSPGGESISGTTVRKAVMMLQAEGWLTGYPGLGVYVAKEPPTGR